MNCGTIFCVIIGASAIDGDTFSPPHAIDPDVRLHGVNAVERREIGHEEARTALQAQVSGEVACRFINWSFSRRAMQCWNENGQDIACELIRLGTLVENIRYSRGRYGECAEEDH